MLEGIHKYVGDRARVTGDGAGAHIVLWPKKRVPEESLITQAAAHGVGVSSISRYFLTPPSQIGLMLRYCRMKEEEIREGVRRLAEIL
jgi:GntR family transcriptional regulator / MocR family aminotransferase